MCVKCLTENVEKKTSKPFITVVAQAVCWKGIPIINKSPEVCTVFTLFCNKTPF